MRLLFSTGLTLTLCVLGCGSSSDRPTPPRPPETVAPPQPHADLRVQPSSPGDTLSVAALSAPGPYHLAPLPNRGVVASRSDRTLELDSAGRVVRELAWGGLVAVDSAGCIYIAGEISQAGELDAFVTKLSPDWELLWTRPFATPEAERPRALAVTSSDEVIVMGSGFGTLALSATGDTRWSSEIAGTDFAIDPEGALIVVGGFIDALELGGTSYYSDQPAVFVAKIDADGRLGYSRAFSGSSEVHVDRVAIGPDQGPVVLGSFRGQVSFGGARLSHEQSQPELSGYLLKLDRDGRHVYSRASDIATTFEAVATEDGSVIFTGNQSAAEPLLDLRVVSSDGSELWRKSGPVEIELGTGFGFDLALAGGELYWSIDAYSAVHSGAVLLPYLVKLAL